jgi:3-hydroxyisobutyrate dehydrogenase
MTVQPSKIVCGFIGLGSQGAPIARRMLRAGYPLVLWARRAETLNAFRDQDVKTAATIEALAAGAQHIGLCVSGDRSVRDVCRQLVPAMQPGACLAIHSTTLPGTSRLVATEAARHGIVFIEAPVSGGGPAADSGTLTVMTAGDVKAIQAARPIFRSFASTVVHLGAVGAAQSAKLINNSLLAAQLAVVHRALAIGEELGLDHQSLLQVLSGSSSRSFALEAYDRLGSAQKLSYKDTLLEKVQLLAEAMKIVDPAADILIRSASALKES